MRPTAITLEWAGGEHTFDLPLREVELLEAETGYGVGMLLHRLQTGQHFSKEPRLTLLYGLIGGGMDPKEARSLVKTWVDGRPGKERDLPAQAVLMSWMMGAPQPKKAKAPKRKNRTEPDVLTSAPSMGSAPR